ncbi:hypothetical protein MA16_Dca019091 [Dendrobium catenatum]|uniref:Chromatin target of PRMT1 protein C-terminal domain-containing protein n=1 Tax=Dendrobium catenatum TaxID=906689 RepID=A0A2I0WP80_9ASPA|nr:hypothetical protein MA16_Dca019091 [Dendrobium catenatum]
MKIEIVGTNIPAPMVVPSLLNDNFRNFNPIPRRGRGRGRGRGESVSAADLDADLDKYHSEAMQTN